KIFGEDITIIGYTNSDSKEDNASYFTNDAYMKWVIYETNLFGDPSMDIWTDAPTDIVATYPSQISIGASAVNVTTNAPFARIGMVQNGELIGRAIATSNGNASVQFTSPVIGSEPVEVSVIAHNRHRHQGIITVFTNQACVLFDSFQISDPTGNNNGIADFGEMIELSLGVKNVGQLPANNVTVTLSSSSGYALINDNVEVYGNFQPGQTIFIENAFTFVVAPDVPDQFEIPFNVAASAGSVWNSTFSLTASAPVLELAEYSISDPSGNNDGRLDPGENVSISFEAMNAGHSNAPGTSAELLTSCNYITIINPTANLETLSTGESDEAVFNISVDPSAPIGTMAHFLVKLSSGGYETEKEYTAKIGRIVEDWESGNFYQFNWQFSGSADWLITTSNPYEGIYCAQSGDIANNQFSILKLSYTVMQDDSISFFVKMSSESGGDPLDFYIDSEIVGSWSGNLPWQRVSYALATGTHNFKWFYHKDGSTSSGSDCAWVDYIELPAPPATSASAGMDDEMCEGTSYSCEGIATNYTVILWTTSGDGFFSNSSAVNPEYNPGVNDIQNGSVVLTIAVTGPDGTFTDDMTLTIYPTPVVNLGNDTTVYTYETVLLDAGNPGSSYLWSTGATTQTIEAGSGGITGEIVFWVEVTNDGDCVSSDEVVISFEEYTGIEHATANELLSVYPNPGNGKFLLQLRSNKESEISVQIFNSVSKQVFKQSYYFTGDKFQTRIDLSGLAKGLYYLQVSGAELNEVKKLIVH
ncbi:MAG: T9SS type A sorting domain-containing protein, partial [Bacteroidetes bacterium]|nr:T9SS type A sorting domain-containing protein [Bacteroidota bacterium]